MSNLIVLREELSADDCESDDTDSASDSESINDLNGQMSSVKEGFQISISESTAKRLYDIAGLEEIEIDNAMNILPKPHIITTSEENLIFEAKKDLGINFDLDKFQVQALVALQNHRNVVLLTPCGSGKMLVFYMGVHLMRKIYGIPNGLGICLQPLNMILSEKTNTNPPIKTAYLSMTGEGMKSDNVQLSHSLDEISSGEIGCLLGHAESFLSSRGILENMFYYILLM